MARTGQLAFGAISMTTEVTRNYPRTVDLNGSSVNLRYMAPADASVALAFARALPAHDLLFLRRDITQPEAINILLNGIERGRITSVLAESGGNVQGYSTVV